MNGLPYYKAYPRDFIEGTIGMSFELKAAYRLVLDLIYMQGGNLPDDARYISGLLGCTMRKWNVLRDDLISIGKIEITGEFLTNKRAVIELETLAKLQEKQSERASTPRKNKGLQKPRLSQPEPDTDNTSSLRSDVSVKPDFESEFEQQFWPAYPRRVGKGQALKAFRAARKQNDLETIMAGVRRYAASRQGENPEFTKHASTWLNGQCWLDEADPKFTAHRNEPPPKPRNIGDALRDEARRLGVLKDGTVSENRGFHSEGNAGGNVTVLDLAFKPALKGFG
ncbi:DUF1376 domain-containing protein [Brucella pseudogrignonensis]|uniref:DUF1376 domain-containing protein n=1 Tax=Brucella pseudogrignonensis TaxID=419475 RepID=UPI003ED089E7